MGGAGGVSRRFPLVLVSEVTTTMSKQVLACDCGCNKKFCFTDEEIEVSFGEPPEPLVVVEVEELERRLATDPSGTDESDEESTSFTALMFAPLAWS